MITAREAATLAEQSDARMAQRLEQIGEKVRTAANLNERELILDYALPYDEAFKLPDQLAYRNPELSPLQRKMRDKLKEYGFALEIKMVRTKIGGGLDSMNVEVKYEDVPHLYIRW